MNIKNVSRETFGKGGAVMVYAIVSGFIAFDWLTGTIGALKGKVFNSTNMREGLYHKCGSILLMIFGAFCDYAQSFIDLGISIPIGISICSYIIIMEIGSIIENIGKINPDILPEVIKSRFFKLKGDE